MTIIFNGQPLLLGYVGLGVYANRLLYLLSTLQNFRIIVLHPEDQPLPQLPTGVTAIGIPGRAWFKRPLFLNAFWSHQLAAYARKNYPREIYLCPSPSWGLLMPARTVVVVHDVIYRRFRRYQGKRFIRKLFLAACERFAENAWKVITISEFSKNEIIALTRIKEEKISIIPNWIEPSFIEAAKNADLLAIRKKYSLPERYWLYIGGYDYRKNVEFLIQAYARTEQTSVPPLVLAGKIPTDMSQPYCDIHRSILSSEIEKEKIILPGMIAEEDLPGVYAGAGLFLFPSLMEGFGYPPLEAIAAGVPVIASDIPSLREIFPRGCNSLVPLNCSDWVSAMKKAAENPETFRCSISKTFLFEQASLAYQNLLQLDRSRNE